MSKWDVYSATDMSAMFLDTRALNDDISKGDVLNVVAMYEMCSLHRMIPSSLLKGDEWWGGTSEGS